MKKEIPKMTRLRQRINVTVVVWSNSTLHRIRSNLLNIYNFYLQLQFQKYLGFPGKKIAILTFAILTWNRYTTLHMLYVCTSPCQNGESQNGDFFSPWNGEIFFREHKKGEILLHTYRI
jgi:hypothetical protein